MALLGDLAETGNCPAQFQVNALAEPRAELSPISLFSSEEEKITGPKPVAEVYTLKGARSIFSN